MKLRLPWKKRTAAKRTIWEEILRRLFLYRNEIHFGKKEPTIDGMAELVHFFFEKLLKKKGNFTLEEVPKELEKHDYKRGVINKVDSFVKKLSNMKYTHAKVSKEDIYGQLHIFETLIYQLNKQRPEEKEQPAKKLFMPHMQMITPHKEPKISLSYGNVHVSVPAMQGIRLEELPEAPIMISKIPKPEKLSLNRIEFNNIFETGKDSIKEDHLPDARSAYMMLGDAFARLNKKEKKELHPKLLELYEEIVAK
ncbi:MAG: hypothetical protein KJ709_05810 [Nanoarchaeota archaeon]|nr:hypothetical protein [Nanoarchaeota archaeon]